MRYLKGNFDGTLHADDDVAKIHSLTPTWLSGMKTNSVALSLSNTVPSGPTNYNRVDQEAHSDKKFGEMDAITAPPTGNDVGLGV